jgi:hypothetical protein
VVSAVQKPRHGRVSWQIQGVFPGKMPACYDGRALPKFEQNEEEHMKSRRSLVLLAILAGVFTFAACPSRTTIGKINADPQRYFDKEVGIAGTVVDSYGVPFVGGAYEIDDGSGKIWVVTERGTPSKGSRVGVKGHVVSGPVVKGRTFGTAIRESDRRAR